MPLSDISSIGVDEAHLHVKAGKKEYQFHFSSAGECRKYSGITQLITSRASPATKLLTSPRALLALPTVNEWKSLVLRGAEVKTLKAGEPIIRTGTLNSSIFQIARGSVRVEVTGTEKSFLLDEASDTKFANRLPPCSCIIGEYVRPILFY